MRRRKREPEGHLGHRAAWLRAAVLGADDGILSTASLVLGVAASGASTSAIVTAGSAGLVAGALSMAAGEYVSVSSQRDTELADLRLEERELGEDPEGELEELAAIYESRGLSRPLASQVAVELSKGDRLAIHAREELGMDAGRQARPFQAAWASALSFTAGAAVPLLAIALAPTSSRAAICVVLALAGLGLLGAFGAVLGGAPKVRAASRVLAWGSIAMATTSGIGALAGAVV